MSFPVYHPRKEDEILPIGTVTFKTLRAFIQQHLITDRDTLFLDENGWDNIVLQHRRYFSEALTVPYFFEGVLIEEALRGTVPSGSISVARNDIGRREFYKQQDRSL